MKLGKINDLPLDKFINLSLYDRNFGYYMKKNPFGKKGDFPHWKSEAFYLSALLFVLKFFEKDTIIPPQYFEELGFLPNVELYSLHKDDGIDDIPSNIIPLHEHKRSWFETWDDTFAAISQLDLTISSSTNIPIV